MKPTILFLSVLFLLNACQPEKTQPSAGADTTSNENSAGSGFTPANGHESAIYSRAFNAVIWGLPAVNSELMYESLVQAKGDYNRMTYWSNKVNDLNQTLTPNPDVIYFNPFYDTREGPVVLEIPPADGVSTITGSIDDAWQTALEDVGPAGVDKGKGGKYLILPPDREYKMPAGYIPLHSSVYTGFIILRSNLTDGSAEDIARAVAYGKKVKIYPLSQEGKAIAEPLDLLKIPFSGIIPYDIRFFESLHRFVQREPWLMRDMAMIDQLKTIGIEKGKPFAPDARTKEILNAAIKDAHLVVRDLLKDAFKTPFYEGTQWALPASPEAVEAIMANYGNVNSYPVDARALIYSIAYFSTKHLGAGQFYLMTISDKLGQPLHGEKTYQLHIPPKVPVSLYWSMTVYDGETHALIKGVPSFSRSSTSPGLQTNDDGSVDVYFGPKAPAGKENNWVPTQPGKQFEILARFYGPEKAFFDKTWTMGDLEEVKE